MTGLGKEEATKKLLKLVENELANEVGALIEYYAHLAMMETDADRVLEEDKHLLEALQGCVVRTYGRLYSRLQIATLCISIGAHTTGALEEDGDDAAPEFKSAALWKDLREQLIIVKSFLLRKDANANVPIQRKGYDDDDIPPENDELDGVLEKHEMFQDNYREVLLSIEVQEILARFCEHVTSMDAKASNLVKELETAVNSYDRELQRLFGDKIPEELTGFLLPELYKKPEQAVGLLLRDALAVMNDEECVYSTVQLKQKVGGPNTMGCEAASLFVRRLTHILRFCADEVRSYQMVRKHFGHSPTDSTGIWRCHGSNRDKRRR